MLRQKTTVESILRCTICENIIRQCPICGEVFKPGEAIYCDPEEEHTHIHCQEETK
jgi:hypothetical protein